MSDIYAKIPQPLGSIGCQDLLKQPISHCGWVRKRHLASKLKLFRWPQVYMVVSTGCVYYFRNEYCKSPAGKFSLFGFNSVTRAQDVKSKEALYPFKIDHTHKDEFKSYYFACSSEVEMKDWMKVIKEELKLANNAEKRDGDYYYTQGFSPSKARTEQTPDAQGFSNDSGFGPSGDGDTASISYKDIEESIYDDPYQFKPPQDYGLYAKKADEASDDEDIPDNPPPVPPRGACTPSTGGKKKKKRRKHKKDSAGELPDVSKVSVSKSESAAKEMAAAVTKEMEGHFEKKNAKGPDSSKRKPSNASQSSVEDDSRKMSLVSDPGGDDIDEEEEDDPDNYWNKIYYEGDKDLASELIRDMGENGVYLVRGGGGGDGQVLVVFAENMPKKYKIQSKDGKFFIAQAGPHEDSLEELLYEYYGTDLPNTSVKLSTPFQLHPKYDT